MNRQDNRVDDYRLCFVGDSFVHGTGDPRGLGWVGQVIAHAHHTGWQVTAYNLGVRGDTSREVLARWKHECLPRFPGETQHYVVFSFGVNDVIIENDTPRISTIESRENFQRLLETTQSQCHALVIGPPPVEDTMHNAHIQDLSEMYGQIAAAMQVPYLSVVESLLNNTIWMKEVSLYDGAHPSSEGYLQLAELILGWTEWPFHTA